MKAALLLTLAGIGLASLGLQETWGLPVATMLEKGWPYYAGGTAILVFALIALKVPDVE
jgi:hypothetical protein